MMMLPIPPIKGSRKQPLINETNPTKRIQRKPRSPECCAACDLKAGTHLARWEGPALEDGFPGRNDTVVNNHDKSLHEWLILMVFHVGKYAIHYMECYMGYTNLLKGFSLDLGVLHAFLSTFILRYVWICVVRMFHVSYVSITV